MGDITWVAFAGREVPRRGQEIFDLVKAARDKVPVAFAGERLQAGQTVYGYEVDDACRDVIRAARPG